MSFVFISHAAPDKLARVKPLVHALAIEGVRLWLDRPGAGDSHFNFDDAFIARHGIQGLRSGVGYDVGIREALRGCSAVLVCLSRTAVKPERRVLQQEMAIAWCDEKFVPCIVDDLPFDQIPDLGLPDLVRTQSERVDSAALALCLAWLDGAASRTPDALPAMLQPAWQTVRKIRDDLAAAAQRSARPRGVAPPSARVAALLALLAGTARPLPLLLRTYRRSLPDPARELPAPTLAELLRDLDDCRPRQPLLPSPLIEFAERLARALDDAALRQWVAAHSADDLSAQAALHNNLDLEQQQRQPKLRLFVDLDPDVLHQIRWWLHAPDPRHCSGEEVMALGEQPQVALAACLSQGLALARARAGSDDAISVALLLPPRLLAAGLDSLAVRFDDDDELGPTLAVLHRRYPVTLHWRKRLGARGQPGKAAINAWNNVLDTLEQRVAQGAGASVAWVDPEAQAALLDPLAGAVARLRDPADDAVCIGLGPLAPASARCLDDEVAACLREGIPCFFWFGRPPAAVADTWRQAVCSEFARHSPADAANQVGLLRKISGAASPFASLCVVWDVPDLMRLPETFNL